MKVPAFAIKEISQESTQRQRREATNFQSGHHKKPARTTLLLKIFNIHTYKFHALGDYEKMIKMFGMTDSYTTQVVIVCHIELFV